jgi:hypothetical protein
MSNPTIMSPHQHAAAVAEITGLRWRANHLRTNAPNASFPDSIWAAQRATDLERAADFERMANSIAGSIAQSNAAERAMLQDHVTLCQRRVLDADRYGSIAQREEAEGCRLDAMAALLAFNQRTIRMVPVTHVRA